MKNIWIIFFSFFILFSCHSTQKLEVANSPLKKILPKKLKKGDKIGLITPGSSISEEQLNNTINQLKSMGYQPIFAPSVLSRHGYLAGLDKERANELMSMFANKDIDAIMCVRGGYGSIRILNLLDYKIIKNNPKIFIGYSDITALTNSITQKTGLVTFHGPLGVTTMNDFNLNSFNKVLVNPQSSLELGYKKDENTDKNPEFDLYTIRKGIVEGELVGGNLSVLESMVGSEFEPNFKGKIVFIEDIGEKTYRVDKMLFHLLQATNLREAKGIVFGVFKSCNVVSEKSLTLKTALYEMFYPLNIPVSYGLTFGHIDHMITIPIGVKAQFDAGNNTLKLLQKAVNTN